MAYKEIKHEWNRLLNGCVCEYICDTEEDITTLPECECSSTCIVVTEGMPIYMKNASGEWKKV